MRSGVRHWDKEKVSQDFDYDAIKDGLAQIASLDGNDLPNYEHIATPRYR